MRNSERKNGRGGGKEKGDRRGGEQERRGVTPLDAKS